MFSDVVSLLSRFSDRSMPRLTKKRVTNGKHERDRHDDAADKDGYSYIFIIFLACE